MLCLYYEALTGSNNKHLQNNHYATLCHLVKQTQLEDSVYFNINSKFKVINTILCVISLTSHFMLRQFVIKVLPPYITIIQVL